MNLLALESSAKAASVAIAEDGRLVAQYFQSSGLTHSRTLMAMAEQVLAQTDRKLLDLDGIAVAAGPGSFTGVRIGVAAAKGMAWGADLPILPVSTLEAMANLCYDSDVTICPVMDARRGQVYNALFARQGDGLTRLCQDRALSAAELAQQAASSDRPFYLLGDGAELVSGVFEKAGVPFRLAPEALRLQSAWGVALAAANVEPVPGALVSPTYLRLSQAERERLEKTKNGGI